MQTWKQEPRMTACKEQALPLCLKAPVWDADTQSCLCQVGMCCSVSITPPVVQARGLGSWSGQKAQKIYFQNIRWVQMLTGARLSCPTRVSNCPLRLQSPRDPVGVGVCMWVDRACCYENLEPHETTASSAPVCAYMPCLLPRSCLAGLEEGFHCAQLLLISHLCCQGSH